MTIPKEPKQPRRRKIIRLVLPSQKKSARNATKVELRRTNSHPKERDADPTTADPRTFIQRILHRNNKADTKKTTEESNSGKVPFDESLVTESDEGKSDPYEFYDEVSGVGRSNTSIKSESPRLGIAVRSDASSGAPPSVVVALPRQISKRRSHRDKKKKKKKNGKYYDTYKDRLVPGRTHALSDVSTDSSESTYATSFTGDDSTFATDKDSEFRDPLQSSCNQDSMLDAAEYYMDTLAAMIWPYASEKDKNEKSQYSKKPTRVPPARGIPLCGVSCRAGSSTIYTEATEETDDEARFRESKEALKSMLGEAVKRGGSLVASTIGTIQTIMEENTEEDEVSSIIEQNGRQNSTKSLIRKVSGVNIAESAHEMPEESDSLILSGEEKVLETYEIMPKESHERNIDPEAWGLFQFQRKHKKGAKHAENPARSWGPSIPNLCSTDERDHESGLKIGNMFSADQADELRYEHRQMD